MHEACACIYAQHRCVCLYASASDIKRNVCAPLMAGQSIHPPVPQQSLSMSVSIVAKRWKEKKKSRTLVGLHESFPSTPPVWYHSPPPRPPPTHSTNCPFLLFHYLTSSVHRWVGLYRMRISIQQQFPLISPLYILHDETLSLCLVSQ